MLFSFLKASIMNESLSYDDALKVFKKHAPGVDVASLSTEELKKLWRKTALKLHPDKNSGKDMGLNVFNSAYDTLKKPGAREDRDDDGFSYRGGSTTSRGSQTRSEVPEWAWAGHFGGAPPSSNIWQMNYKDQNYFKKRMWELSKKSKEAWTIQAYDGHFFRSMITVFGNESIFKEMAKAMVTWNSEGANPYKTRAVFVSNRRTYRHLLLIYLDGKHLKEPIRIDHESMNSNPANDERFMRELPKILDDIAANGFKNKSDVKEATTGEIDESTLRNKLAFWVNVDTKEIFTVEKGHGMEVALNPDKFGMKDAPVIKKAQRILKRKGGSVDRLDDIDHEIEHATVTTTPWVRITGSASGNSIGVDVGPNGHTKGHARKAINLLDEKDMISAANLQHLVITIFTDSPYDPMQSSIALHKPEKILPYLSTGKEKNSRLSQFRESERNTVAKQD